MSVKNLVTENWPKINSIVAINPGTRIDTGNGLLSIVPGNLSVELYGVVIELHPHEEWQEDRIDILFGDKVYQIMRTPNVHPTGTPYFNLREIKNDNTASE